MLASLLKRRGGEPADPSQKTAEAIERTTSRMNRLIQDLLDLTRMDAGRLAVEPDCISALQIVSECVNSQKGLIASASLELELAPNLPCVRADQHRLVQILENLIGNAVKFTKPGGRITLGAMPDDSDVLFWIKNTGVGVAAEHLPHLFDRFWQASAEDGRRGLGLGLPIVKGLVESQGGRIWIESALCEGTTIFFTVPAAPPGEQVQAAHEPPEP
jgi:signal transduction histidine kinase